jgi:hypothetical protein
MAPWVETRVECSFQCFGEHYPGRAWHQGPTVWVHWGAVDPGKYHIAGRYIRK